MLLLRRMICLAAMLAPALSAQALKLLSDENAPFGYTDPITKKVTGVTAEMAVEASKRAMVPITLELFPWARAYSLAKSEPDTCVYPLARLPERESSFQWVGPLSSNKWVLFARSDFQGVVNNLTDVEKYVIGGLRLDGPAIFLKSKGLNVEMVADSKLNVRKLAAGRIDLWATGLYRGKAIAAEAGIAEIKPVLVIKDVDHYLACNAKVPKDVVKALNRAVETMHGDGWIKKTSDRYQNSFVK
jgi:polar amino acid transport system substrate-binding protein